jgi:hypothetical protein
MTDAPASAPRAVAPFSFLGPRHPFAAGLERFAAHLGHDLLVPGPTVHADLTTRPAPDGGLELHRVYWSAQSHGADGFAARTLVWSAKRDRATWLTFPADPELPALAGLAARASDVLRYVPQRRCTLLVDGEDGSPAIAKVKRPHRAAEAWRLLGAVHRALGHGRAGFDVSAPLRRDADRATFTQTALAGEDLAAITGTGDGPALMRRAGALHAAMHRADVPGAPALDARQRLAELRADAAWVAFALPEHGASMAEVVAALERHADPVLGAPAAFCHGDLVPSQMLVGAERWAITDFDGCHLGDPHRDLAIWLAALAYDVPALRLAAEAGDGAVLGAAEAAYLDGYGERDEERLRWHRAAAEIHYLAVALKKDRHHPARFARGLALARGCAESLG